MVVLCLARAKEQGPALWEVPTRVLELVMLVVQSKKKNSFWPTVVTCGPPAMIPKGAPVVVSRAE